MVSLNELSALLHSHSYQVGSGIFKSSDPAKRARAIVKAELLDEVEQSWFGFKLNHKRW